MTSDPLAPQHAPLLIEARDWVLYGDSHQKLAGPFFFQVRAGDCLIIRGPNGAGKSTLLKGLVGLHKKMTGQLTLNLPATRLGFLPQLSNVRFHLPMTLMDVLEIACPAMTGNEIRERTREVGLIDPTTLERDWNSASGGERQRVLITRLFLSQPDVILLDEPANHLDRGSRQALLHLIERFLAGDGISRGASSPLSRAAIVVTHETDLGQSLAHRDLVLEEGAP